MCHLTPQAISLFILLYTKCSEWNFFIFGTKLKIKDHTSLSICSSWLENEKNIILRTKYTGVFYKKNRKIFQLLIRATRARVWTSMSSTTNDYLTWAIRIGIWQMSMSTISTEFHLTPRSTSPHSTLHFILFHFLSVSFLVYFT